MHSLFHVANHALQSAEGSLGVLRGQERRDAEELLTLARQHWIEESTPDELLKDVRRLIEVLARRSTQAMPYAALGRALSASATGKEADARALLEEFETKLSLLGL